MHCLPAAGAPEPAGGAHHGLPGLAPSTEAAEPRGLWYTPSRVSCRAPVQASPLSATRAVSQAQPHSPHPQSLVRASAQALSAAPCLPWQAGSSKAPRMQTAYLKTPLCPLAAKRQAAPRPGPQSRCCALHAHCTGLPREPLEPAAWPLGASQTACVHLPREVRAFKVG